MSIRLWLLGAGLWGAGCAGKSEDSADSEPREADTDTDTPIELSTATLQGMISREVALQAGEGGVVDLLATADGDPLTITLATASTVELDLVLNDVAPGSTPAQPGEI
jgi:hypothetical protein